MSNAESSTLGRRSLAQLRIGTRCKITTLRNTTAGGTIQIRSLVPEHLGGRDGGCVLEYEYYGFVGI